MHLQYRYRRYVPLNHGYTRHDLHMCSCLIMCRMFVHPQYRYRRYVPLTDLERGPWDLSADLPQVYKRLYQFDNFRGVSYTACLYVCACVCITAGASRTHQHCTILHMCVYVCIIYVFMYACTTTLEPLEHSEGSLAVCLCACIMTRCCVGAPQEHQGGSQT
jgi:hypothetical protein